MTNDRSYSSSISLIIRAGKTRLACSFLVKALALGRQPAHLLGWLKARAEILVFLEHVEDAGQSEGVGPAQDAATCRREADAEDQAHVDIARLAHDAFGEHPAGLDQHGQEQPISNFFQADFTAAGADLFQDRVE